MIQRIRQSRPETRTGCYTFMHITLDKASGKYVVMNFVKEQGHKMASKSSIPYLHSHRNVTDGDYAQVSATTKAGAKISQVMKFFAMQCGGNSNVAFALKDLYNRVDLERRAQIETGAKALHETEDTIVILATKLKSLEKHAAVVYTRNVFFFFRSIGT